MNEDMKTIKSLNIVVLKKIIVKGDEVVTKLSNTQIIKQTNKDKKN